MESTPAITRKRIRLSLLLVISASVAALGASASWAIIVGGDRPPERRAGKPVAGSKLVLDLLAMCSAAVESDPNDHLYVDRSKGPYDYRAVDKADPDFQATAHLMGRVLSISLSLKAEDGSGKTSRWLSSKVEYSRILRHFAGRFDTIEHEFAEVSQGRPPHQAFVPTRELKKINSLTGDNHRFSLPDAVMQTESSKLAEAAGFSKIVPEYLRAQGDPGDYYEVIARFARPQAGGSEGK